MPAQAHGSPAPAVPPAAPPAPPPASISPATTLQGHGPGPDLSSLVSTARGWGDPAGMSGRMPTAPPAPPHPANGPNGSNGAPFGMPQRPSPAEDPLAHFGAQSRGASASGPFAHSDPMFDAPGSTFGSGVLSQKRRSSNMLYIAVGGAALAVIAVVIVIAATSGPKKTTQDNSVPAPAAPATPVAVADPNTGFDLYVTPGGVMTWRLDGESRKDKLPSRIRGITPGVHQVAIDAPAGFMSQTQSVTVETGKAPKVEIVLTPLSITGDFESTPPGATVSLIIDGQKQTLGPSPQKVPLDPHKEYKVLFEKAGYVSVNRPVMFSGQLVEPVVVALEKIGGAAAAPPAPPPAPPPADAHVAVTPPAPPKHDTPPVAHPAPPVAHVDTPPKQVTPPKTDVPPTPPKTDVAPPEPPKAKGQGTLVLGSKPPCQVYIDGSDSGKSTPIRPGDMKLDAGKHKVTLVNNEFGIKETFYVDIKADEPTKQIKDYSDRLPK
jgi:hypothetical protein